MKYPMLVIVASLLSGCGHEKECPSGYERDSADCVPSEASGGAGGTSSGATGGSSGESTTSGGETTSGGSGGTGQGGGAGAAGAAPDGGANGGSAGAGAECSVPQEDVLGEVCASDDDCECSAPLCAKSPFDDYGFCTVGDCDVDDDQCPDGYHCIEIAIANITYCGPDA